MLQGHLKLFIKYAGSGTFAAPCYSYYNTKQCAHMMATFEILNCTFI